MRDSSRLAAGPTVFWQKLAKCGGIQHLLSQRVLQVGVLVLDLLQTLGLGDIHATVFCLPL
jgi:hypothetical protein